MNPYYGEFPQAKALATQATSTKAGAGARAGVKATKDSGFPGVPGKTQPKDRSGGTSKKGSLGPFHVKSEGI